MNLTKLEFKVLPDYARFLLTHQLEAVARMQLQLSRDLNVPILKFFKDLPETQLVELSIQSSTEILTAFADNKINEFIELSVQNWINNQLPMIGRNEIVAEDITVFSFIRKQNLRIFLPLYTSDLQLALAITEEIDVFITASESASINTFMALQNEEINKINTILQARNSELAEAQEIARMGSYEWDMVTHQNTISPFLANLFQIEKGTDLLGFMEGVHPDDRAKVQAALESSFNGNGIYDCEYRYHKSGQEKVLWSRGIVGFQEGKAVNMKGTVMDVTDRHHLLVRLEETSKEMAKLNLFLEQKNQELEQKNKELESFNYAISHDLQEPLRKIQIFSNMLESGYASMNEVARMAIIGKINNSAARLRKLINDLFSFSFLSPSGDSEKADVASIVEDVINDYQLIIEEKNAVFHIGPLPIIKARTTLVYQLFQNLISNAIKYVQEETTPVIWIDATVVPGESVVGATGAVKGIQYHKISIRDNGIGFDPQYSEKIFDLFQRLHNKKEYSGTGIGLSMCKKIVAFYNGFITVTSQPSQGACFVVYLPIQEVDSIKM